MSRYGSGYSDDFKKNKIFWAGMSNANNFLYSSSEIYINDFASHNHPSSNLDPES